MHPEDCPVERLLSAVGAKWTPMILFLLAGDLRRFGELRRMLPGVSPRILTDRLRTLEQLGLLDRTVHAEVPPRVEYALTGRGRELAQVLQRMAEWFPDEGTEIPGVPAPRAGSRGPVERGPWKGCVTPVPLRPPPLPSAPRRPAGPAA